MEGYGQQAALKIKEIDCDGHQIKFRECKSPSDILWLNRGVSRSSQLLRGLIVIFIILVVVVLVYFIFTGEVSY